MSDDVLALAEIRAVLVELRADRDRLAARADTNADQWAAERERAEALAARLAEAEKLLREWIAPGAESTRFDRTRVFLDSAGTD